MPARDYIGIWKMLYDWQTIIAGALAIFAAVIGAAAAYAVGNAQIVAAKRKDRLQARCLAVGIFPELLQLMIRHERATKIIADEFPKAKREGGWRPPQIVAALILDARIQLTPLLNRTLDQLHLLEAGPTLLQLISVILQYNDLTERLAHHIESDKASFDPAEHEKDLRGQLQVIGEDIAQAQRLISRIHDEATKAL